MQFLPKPQICHYGKPDLTSNLVLAFCSARAAIEERSVQERSNHTLSFVNIYKLQGFRAVQCYHLAILSFVQVTRPKDLSYSNLHHASGTTTWCEHL